MHHVYIIPGIVDAAVVHDQAYRRAMDSRDPGETVVHNHRYREPCIGVDHWAYTAGHGESTKFVGDRKTAAPKTSGAQLMTSETTRVSAEEGEQQ